MSNLSSTALSTTQSVALCLDDFLPHAEAPSSSFPTRRFAYPIGARLAYVLYLAKASPNMVSILALLVGLTSAAVCAFTISDPVVGGLVLLVGLQLSYALDCADGVLARATGRCTPFGAIFDKALDSMSMVLIPGILSVGARAFHALPAGWNELPTGWVGLIIVFYATPRISMATVIWMKDLVRHGGDKLVVDQRAHTFGWKITRTVAVLLDTPVCRLFLALSWMLGWFFPWVLCYGAFSWVAFIIYLKKTHREMS